MILVEELHNNLQIWVEQFRGGIHPLCCNHLDLNVFAGNPAVSAYCVEWNGLFVNCGKLVIWHCKLKEMTTCNFPKCNTFRVKTTTANRILPEKKNIQYP